MRKNSLLKGLVSIVGGTALSFAGCRNVIPINRAPEISVSESDGTPVNAIENGEIIVNNDCDEAYLLSLPRGNIEQDQIRLNVLISDPEKKRIEANAYPISNDNNPIRVNIDQGTNIGYETKWNINVEPIDGSGSVPLGTYHMFDIAANDGVNNTTACFYVSVIPGSTVPPGEIPQVNNGNNDVDCHYNSDCDVHEICNDSKCVPHASQPSLLEKATSWSCVNLEGANDTNIRVYKVTPQGNTFTANEIMELAPGHPEATTIYELVRSGPTNSFYIGREGNTPSGQRVGETIRGLMGYDDSINPNAKMSSNVAGGYAPSNCPEIYVINSNPANPTPQPVPDGIFTLFSDGD